MRAWQRRTGARANVATDVCFLCCLMLILTAYLMMRTMRLTMVILTVMVPSPPLGPIPFLYRPAPLPLPSLRSLPLSS